MIKCDFHMHTSWSDGGQGIKEMLNACEVTDMKKAALTDHYKSAAAFDMKEYCREIEELKGEYPFEIFKGVELQWHPDNALDYFKEEERACLDITLCELMGDLIFNPKSQRWEQERKEKAKLFDTVFEAYRKIAEHPHVDIIAHPFNFGRMEFEYNFELSDLPSKMLRELAEAMRENNTAYELQSQFYYWYPKMRVKELLKQQIEVAKIFKDASVKFSVGTDAHDVGTAGNTRWSSKVLEGINAGPECLIEKAQS